MCEWEWNIVERFAHLDWLEQKLMENLPVVTTASFQPSRVLLPQMILEENEKESTLKSTSVSVCFRGISRLPSAFVFLWWFKLAHNSIQVCTSHDGCKQGIDQQIFNRKSISRKITHPQSCKLQAKLTGEKLKGWSNRREKTNSRLQSKFRNTCS